MKSCYIFTIPEWSIFPTRSSVWVDHAMLRSLGPPLGVVARTSTPIILPIIRELQQVIINNLLPHRVFSILHLQWSLLSKLYQITGLLLWASSPRLRYCEAQQLDRMKLMKHPLSLSTNTQNSISSWVDFLSYFPVSCLVQSSSHDKVIVMSRMSLTDDD